MQQTRERVRKASNLRNRTLTLPGVTAFVGRTDPRVTVTNTSAQLPDGTSLPLRIYRPREQAGTRLPVVMNFHGGGWVSGNMQQSEWWASSVAADGRAAVVSVEYRLAPDHPFPVPVEDCYAATCWVVEHAAELDVDAQRLAVMGDSAGGNIAAVVALMARDRGGPPIALQVLIYPSVDLTGDYPSVAENADGPILVKRDVDNAPSLYLRDDADRKNPYASPLLADHSGLPPALIQTAQHDPIRDEGFVYADALREAGVPVRHTNYVDAVHGYISLPGVVPMARQALGEAVAALREAFRN